MVSGYFLWALVFYPHAAHFEKAHIAYAGGPAVPYVIGIAYFVATTLAPALSSFPALRVFAAIVAASAIVSYFYYWEAFSSIWCFFAAGASVVIVLHFERVRQLETSVIKR